MEFTYQSSAQESKERLDKILGKKIIRVSIGDVISELFYGNIKPTTQVAQNGTILQYKLGFLNSEKFCKYIELDNYYVKLCGVPDRISYENGRLYVDELKVTTTNKGDFIRKVGTAQLQLYMAVTGINEGRLFIYYRDNNKLVLDTIVQYDENKVKDLLSKYIAILEMRERYKKAFN
jgi:hypothetical protein